eukprot:366417-Chlamydomonas_euryale.AAC.31
MHEHVVFSALTVHHMLCKVWRAATSRPCQTRSSDSAEKVEDLIAGAVLWGMRCCGVLHAQCITRAPEKRCESEDVEPIQRACS